MKKLLLLLIIPFLSFGQINTFQTFYLPSGFSYSVTPTNDEGYVMVVDGIFLIKTDSVGNELWNKTLGGGARTFCETNYR
jgi:hypothetical protein